MPLINLRDLIAWPNNPDNASDTVINGIHFNKTALEHWNYTYYSNNTISNDSNCFVIFDAYRPTFLSNGSWINGTTCYYPLNSISTRGSIGIAFVAMYGLALVFSLVVLRKHGQLYLQETKRFRAVGRRWTWYWMCFTCACALISTVSSIDVDRNYLPKMPIILQSFFFMLMVPGSLAMVWEATRHWGSWQERQVVDPDPFALGQDDRRSRTEFYLPLIFYLFAWLNFFMTIPRSWSAIEKQRSADQTLAVAAPSGTDSRFKAGSILGGVAYFIIIYSLHHSLKHYKPRPPTPTRSFAPFKSIAHFIAACPTKIFLALVILAVRMAYIVAQAWEWEISVFNLSVNPAWPYALGYAPVLLIMFILIVAGLIERNEDVVLIEQRRRRGRETNAMVGYTPKPQWWRFGKENQFMTAEEQLRHMTTEVGGRAPTANRLSRTMELRNMQGGNFSDGDANGMEMGVTGGSGMRNRSRSRVEDPFSDPSPGTGLTPERTRSNDASSVRTGQSGISGTTLASGNVKPVQVRSMLDI
ncbi:hypothetical protein P152DRAFT_25668 [Eremomyces bilateralis CBS 781.70]|uniref:Uncharacterized protein n=1 Tax=Eremomyces bilateralis CBS 781.70 TaxID=1392243 RepID=A0A6G1GID5_9PEZI|nr:uncharacterized protein P152DRAFT_25668 [Eremomyces bilateralis CBS 781.70]KAF1817649.1 hypothetical protein P152DRAFT_25668 [Eremomyces bilateralis CBS 781.70]